MLVAAGLVTVMLLITFDLDRPVRGLIQVSATPLTVVRASMHQAPAFVRPAGP